MITELISRVFAARNAAHLAHWSTKSYAQHVATGAFYDSVVDKLDGLVEAYQGNFGLVGKVKPTVAEGEILEVLKADVVWIAEHREHIASGIEALENIVDDITALYLQTIYKLENLK